MLGHKARDVGAPGIVETKAIRRNFQRIERREWWLWAAAIIITFLLTIALASFLLPNAEGHHDFYSLNVVPQAVRGLVGLVFLFDLYTIYQHLLIHRIRRELVEREELFHLISQNAADMIAVVDMEGRRLFNSLSYKKVIGYSPEELQSFSAFEQIHPDDREHVKKAAEDARRSGIGTTLEYRLRHKNGTWLVLESTSSVIRNAKGEPEKLVIVNRNITQRKRAEADFRSLVEDAPYGIYRASVTGRFLRVNPALQRMLGYEHEQELLGKDLAKDIFRHNGEYQRLPNFSIEPKRSKTSRWSGIGKTARRSPCGVRDTASTMKTVSRRTLKCSRRM